MREYRIYRNPECLQYLKNDLLCNVKNNNRVLFKSGRGIFFWQGMSGAAARTGVESIRKNKKMQEIENMMVVEIITKTKWRDS